MFTFFLTSINKYFLIQLKQKEVKLIVNIAVSHKIKCFKDKNARNVFLDSYDLFCILYKIEFLKLILIWLKVFRMRALFSLPNFD